ncbi:uncharacterized protein K02A2.6-like [Dendronephthya gigantea]|uniref:uncharacterized protein K02A2.6-like n=1 Tax=Dendronephthya gigantea TaxID=151771 RepID=UPI00106A9104|nr:uncharacterized protein K02A2.6-like [Dendronephthya gigantea]
MPVYSSQRLQKMMMQLQCYDLSVVYKKGTELYIADTLSCAHLGETMADEEDEFEVLMVTPIAPWKMDELKKETASDPVLAKLIATIDSGWPELLKETDTELQVFFNFREQLIVQDDIVFKGEKIVVPSSLGSEYLNQIHQGHPGSEAMKNRVRDIFYWPALSRDVEALLPQCSVCNAYRHHQQKEPLKIHEVPVRPWSVVAFDLFTWNGSDYLITADSYSGWFELDTLNSGTSSRTVIQKLKAHFLRFRIPDELFTDNGPQYSSLEFREFSNEWGFVHKTSSPGFPQSNGLIERAVQTSKRMLDKCKHDGTDPYIALLNLRNTPRDQILGSPAQRLQARRLKSKLPTPSPLLVPKVIDPLSVNEQLLQKRLQQKRYFDKSARPLPSLQIGDKVRVQTPVGHARFGVVRRSPTPEQPRSYIVTVNSKDY